MPKPWGPKHIFLLCARRLYPGRHFSVFNSNKTDFKMTHPFVRGTRWSGGWERLAQVHEQAGPLTGCVYVNHVRWANLTAFGLSRPLAVQMMREPVAREVSAFYFVMWGPRREEDMRKARKKMMHLTGLPQPPNINE